MCVLRRWLFVLCMVSFWSSRVFAKSVQPFTPHRCGVELHVFDGITHFCWIALEAVFANIRITLSIIRFVENGLWRLVSFLSCLGSSSRLHSAWVNCRVASGSTTKASLSHINLAANLEHKPCIVFQLGLSGKIWLWNYASLLGNSIVKSSPLLSYKNRFSGCFFGLGFGLVAGWG